MRYPNLRYGNPNELAYFAAYYPDKDRVRILSKELRRDERTVRDWLLGRKKIPFWVPELMRLRRMERDNMLRQMNIQRDQRRLGLVTGNVIEFQRPGSQQPSTTLDNRLVNGVDDAADELSILAG